MKLVDKQKKRKQRKLRSKSIRGNLVRPRVVLSKSNRYLIAQAINDEKGHTLLYLNTANLDEKVKEASQCRKSQEWAKKLGQIMTSKLKEKKIEKIVFDRNGYPYHGKIQVFCETMRQGGIEF